MIRVFSFKSPNNYYLDALNEYEAKQFLSSAFYSFNWGTGVGGVDWKVCTSFNWSWYATNKFNAMVIFLTLKTSIESLS